MEQITITRKEFRERIALKPEKFGIVKRMHRIMSGQEEGPDVDSVQLGVETISSLMLLKDVERELFGDEDLPFQEEESGRRTNQQDPLDQNTQM